MTSDELAELTEEELFEAFGALLLGRGPGVTQLDPDRLRDFGRARYDGLRAALGAALCNADGTASLPGSSLTDVAAAILAYGVAEGAITTSSEKALVLAAIVTRTGINSFCRSLMRPIAG